MIENMNVKEGDAMAFTTEDPKWTTIKLENGVVLEVRLEITGVSFTGYHDPRGNPTNVPIYSVSQQTVIRVQHIPRELYRYNQPDNRSYR